MWEGNKVSIILPTYNEKDSIREYINELFATGIVDEVIVVNNNAVAGTSEEVSKTKARELFESKQGYGAAIRRAFEEVQGDYIMISEPDGTFRGKDIFKLLVYSDEFDVVFGTRTTRELIWSGANMGFFLRWGNWVVAKMMEFLFNTSGLTDVGCTMRLIKKHALEKIKSLFTVDREHFGLEMMLLVSKEKLKFIQVPVNYKPRVGRSSVTGNKYKAFILGMKMIVLILKYRLLYCSPLVK